MHYILIRHFTYDWILLFVLMFSDSPLPSCWLTMKKARVSQVRRWFIGRSPMCPPHPPSYSRKDAVTQQVSALHGVCVAECPDFKHPTVLQLKVGIIYIVSFKAKGSNCIYKRLVYKPFCREADDMYVCNTLVWNRINLWRHFYTFGFLCCFSMLF